MNFEVEHVFDAPVEAVEAAMFHPQYASFLLERSDLLKGHAVKAMEDDGMHITRRVFLAPKPSFDKIGSKKVPPEWFEFHEESTWDRKARKLLVQNVPTTAKIAQRLINRGEVTLHARPDGKTVRRAKVEIVVHDLPLIARPFTSVIEGILAREAKRMIEEEASVMREWLASHGSLQPIVHA